MHHRPFRLLASSLLTLLLGAAALWLVGSVQAQPAAPTALFTVNSLDDNDDGSCDVTHCSLREAIAAANAAPGHDTIEFALGAITPTITISGSLPALADPVTIDGSSGGSSRVALDGSLATGDGLTLTSSDNVLRNLVIHSFPGSGLAINSDSNLVAGSIIGLDHNGASDLGNGSYGILITDGSFNQIGGSDPADHNLISGNDHSGIRIDNLAASGNIIQGNFIGTDSSGTSAIRNSNYGILIFDSPDNIIGGTAGVTVGGPCTGACNLISGNGANGDDSGIFIGDQEADRTQILGNYIGTDVSGTLDLGNSRDGIILYTYTGNGRGGPDFTQIGGTSPASRNLISGNNRHGIHMRADSSGTIIQGNYIGTDVHGTAALGNSQHGIYSTNSKTTVLGGTTGVTVGGPCTGACNLISGNGANTNYYGAYFADGIDGATIQGNFFGLDMTGAQPLGNGGYGLRVEAQSNALVGGDTPAARNIIAANGISGLHFTGGIDGSNPGRVRGNYLGTDVTGMVDLGNVGYGLVVRDCYNCLIEGNLASGNSAGGIYTDHSTTTSGAELFFYGNSAGLAADGQTPLPNDGPGFTINGIGLVGEWTHHIRIGGPEPGQGNVFSANGSHGILFQDRKIRDVTISGNFIGTDATGTLALGNGGDGIHIAHTTNSAVPNVIGGETPAYANLIVNNAGNGITVLNRTSQTIRQNQIADNGGLGIDLNNDGVTANDPDDLDSGANDNLNFPVLTGAYYRGGATTISGALNTISNTMVTVDLYGVASCDGSAHGEGDRPLGLLTTTTDAAGNASFNLTVAETVPAGQFVVATTTDAAGNSSEFSACLPVQLGSGGLSGSVSTAGTPAAGIELLLYQQVFDGNQNHWWLIDAASSAGDGSYGFSALAPGRYAIRFRDPAGVYAQTYYAGAFRWEDVTPIVVADGAVVSGLAEDLLPAGQVSGQVTLPDLVTPLPDIQVVAYLQNGGSYTPFSATTTDGAGQYDLTGLTQGDYRVGFFDNQGVYGHEYYSETLEFSGALTVTVSAGAVITEVNGTLENVPPTTTTEGLSGRCSAQYDPSTGQFVLRNHIGDPCEFDLTVPAGLIECPDGGLLLTVNALVQGVLFELTEDPPGSGIYTGHISLDGHTGGLMELVWTCSNGSFSEPLGRIKLWDPSGYVTDAVTGEPIPGASVTLYQVLDWRPRNHTEDVGPNSCESNSSKPAGQPWSQAAP
ncbi:MAG: CSLREA domain-containing protein, partial [Anaerolineales bacterium]|nr:CSLREA domain-containing protein [Anaerolineales bacterium]